jgi:hypothetical protein
MAFRDKSLDKRPRESASIRDKPISALPRRLWWDRQI